MKSRTMTEAFLLNQLLKLPPDVHENIPKDLIQGAERFIQQQDRRLENQRQEGFLQPPTPR